ncbi:hypothetical protein LR48_Vigan03g175600 [Vigna angularis]|uniref:Uncharacterized protein n=1 Tax=Phaseolus angularis TaxID=3914 RepID=A0A0L9U7E9_PHAAN|nr:uncharacterized protein LOC108329579 isoform X1 [Vigna angularis]KOM38374.1 hypothetical protein LR48_Vigan03g175600 [Vigna angularis]
MRYGGGRKRRMLLQPFLVLCATVTSVGLLMLALRPLDPPITVDFPRDVKLGDSDSSSSDDGGTGFVRDKPCATVEEMGKDFENGVVGKETLRVRRIIEDHFVLNGASRIRDLPPEQFCSHGFVLGKTAEAGFGNEMYKVLTAAALSIMLNRSLIIGQTRGKYPFGDYISYSNYTFTMNEIKHLWRENGCGTKYGRQLVMRTDDFEKPAQTNVLCSNWKEWKQPIIWFQGTTDAVAAQFFLKNIHSQMRKAAFDLFGDPQVLGSQPNVFGEIMRVLVSPSKDVEAAVNWVIGGGENPDISLHMRMLMNRSIRAVQAALHCIKKALESQHLMSRPKVVVVSDTPTLVESIVPNISEFAQVIYFDYKKFKGNAFEDLPKKDFRVKDWGPAPRWVAFVDFFLASRAKYAVVSGAHRRVGTTYAQLIAALAATRNLGENSTGSSFSFLSSFQSNILTEGLKNQIGWGHVWNRYAGQLSCHNQTNQCAFTPILPPGWWDGLMQSPIPKDINRLAAYGITLSVLGTVDFDSLQNHCSSRKNVERTITFNL